VCMLSPWLSTRYTRFCNPLCFIRNCTQHISPWHVDSDKYRFVCAFILWCFINYTGYKAFNVRTSINEDLELCSQKKLCSNLGSCLSIWFDGLRKITGNLRIGVSRLIFKPRTLWIQSTQHNSLNYARLNKFSWRNSTIYTPHLVLVW
jgi:GT2 family glycosyltransferase